MSYQQTESSKIWKKYIMTKFSLSQDKKEFNIRTFINLNHYINRLKKKTTQSSQQIEKNIHKIQPLSMIRKKEISQQIKTEGNFLDLIQSTKKKMQQTSFLIVKHQKHSFKFRKKTRVYTAKLLFNVLLKVIATVTKQEIRRAVDWKIRNNTATIHR